jgi:excisionase family DNA binding protein
LHVKGALHRTVESWQAAAMNARLLHTPSEAAELVRIPESWLRKKAAARLIPCTFVGKHLRFSDDDLQTIIESGARQARGAAGRPGGHSPRRS